MEPTTAEIEARKRQLEADTKRNLAWLAAKGPTLLLAAGILAGVLWLSIPTLLKLAAVAVLFWLFIDHVHRRAAARVVGDIAVMAWRAVSNWLREFTHKPRGFAEYRFAPERQRRSVQGFAALPAAGLALFKGAWGTRILFALGWLLITFAWGEWKEMAGRRSGQHEVRNQIAEADRRATHRVSEAASDETLKLRGTTARIDTALARGREQIHNARQHEATDFLRAWAAADRRLYDAGRPS